MRQRQPCAKRCASLHLKSLEPTRVGHPTFSNGFGRVDHRFQLPCIAPASAAQSKQKLSLAGIGHTSEPKVPTDFRWLKPTGREIWEICRPVRIWAGLLPGPQAFKPAGGRP